MKKDKNAIIILSHHMDANGTPGTETLARIELAAKLFQNDSFDFIVTSGWDYRDDSILNIGDIVALNMLSNYPIDKENIIVDINARDTVGDAYFTRRNIVSPLNIRSITVVTSCYHVKRADMIFRAFFAPTVHVTTAGTAMDLCDKNAILLHEENSCRAFVNTFKEVDISDDIQVFDALSLKHPFYNGYIHPKISNDLYLNSPCSK